MRVRDFLMIKEIMIKKNKMTKNELNRKKKKITK
jgi:hypothetical protein